ncbi:MAG: Ig-like domain-containing protein [Clostridiales bacterium]|nr:Ig-like domain-containing protein [Clostridiales bacterium]
MKHLRMLALAIALISLAGCATKETFAILAPENWELSVGDSRTLDYSFPLDADKDRTLSWKSTNEAVAVVDKWGRVTAKAPGQASIVAEPSDIRFGAGTVSLTVVDAPTSGAPHADAVNYKGTPEAEYSGLQKSVERFDLSARNEVPRPDDIVLKSLQTFDGAAWKITDYGILRTQENAINERDREMRFMGDRWFYDLDVPLGILGDGDSGIWTRSENGITHISFVEMSGTSKAETMSATTQEIVARHGLVSEASFDPSNGWKPVMTDNDGLWTAMYGAGELFRYAVLREEQKKNPDNADLKASLQAAKESATRAVEAVLLLSNISMRTGEVDAYVRANPPGFELKRGLTQAALVENGDYSRLVPNYSPALFTQPINGPIPWLSQLKPESWQDTMNSNLSFDFQKRSLSGFIARTFYLDSENQDPHGIYFEVSGNSAKAISSKNPEDSDLRINGEHFIGKTVDASGEIPERLFKASEALSKDDLVYKGDTSTDEIIGHLFIYKIAYDILGSEDPELAGIISDTMDRFAQHVADNSYMLVDMTGQPTTWGRMSRDFFYSYTYGFASSPLYSSVLLSTFKTAAYVTGSKKWEDEYQFAAKSFAYQYSKVMGTYAERAQEYLNLTAFQLMGVLDHDIRLADSLKAQGYDQEMEFLFRSFLNYSDEEMAMLAFYLLFQMETDPALLEDYRNALEEWWASIKYSENPLWYYIYQLAYPDQQKTDAYGNNLLKTASWALGRHPLDTRKLMASNPNRDDIAVFNLEKYNSALVTRGGISVKKSELPPESMGLGILSVFLEGALSHKTLEVEYAVAAPDERALHKFNNSTYVLDDDYNPNQMEGSTTYTLPYWLGRYHGMLGSGE